MPLPGQLNYARARFGIAPVHRPSGWSVISEGEPKFAIHQFSKEMFFSAYGRTLYAGLGVGDFGEHDGFLEWRGHLNWAWENDTRIRIIVFDKSIPNGNPNRFVAREDTVMRLVALNQGTGAFLAIEEPLNLKGRAAPPTLSATP